MRNSKKFICSLLAVIAVLMSGLSLSGCSSETTIDDLAGVWVYQDQYGGKTVVEILPDSNGTMKMMSNGQVIVNLKAGYQIDKDNNLLIIHLLDNNLNQTTASLQIMDGWLYTMEGDKMDKN